VSDPLIGLAAFVTAAFGAVGGIGGAVLLVPLLVLTGTEVATAAPLGLLSVAAGSLAAAAPQLAERTVNHRLAVCLEVFASAGAVAGALVAGNADEDLLRVVLAVVAAAAGLANLMRRGVRNRPIDGFPPSAVGEWKESLAGAYVLSGGVVPYRATRLPLGLAAITASGFIAGVSGASGGFIKTPVMTDVMRVPVKVSAPTTTFTVGVTAATALIVFALQDRIDLHLGAIVLATSIVGGTIGARLQANLAPPVVRRLLSALLLAVAAVLVASA